MRNCDLFEGSFKLGEKFSFKLIVLLRVGVFLVTTLEPGGRVLLEMDGDF